MKKKEFSTIALYIVFIAGLIILSYPFVSNWLAARRGIEASETYEAMTSSLTDEERQREWEKAKIYNDHLRGDPVKDPFLPGSGAALPSNYMEVLDIDGIMGYIEIPDIDVKLPIYHGVAKEVLEKGIGHIESTALPIGGLGGHSVLTGHTGLPSAKLFTDLVKMQEGDMFYIHVLGERLVYEVDQIKVIEPEDLSDLMAYDDKDYVTLLTCTPYGVNSHRLLVRGERTYSYSERVSTVSHRIIYRVLFFVFVMICLLWLYFQIWRKRAAKERGN